MAGHPTRNPFPARGTSSAEETSRRDFRDDWARHTPTALLPGVRGAVRLSGEYLRAFRGGAAGEGGLGCLYGAHGVGKTHAARHMMAQAGREAPEAVQLYLRFQEDDFVAAYRRLVSQLPQTLLTDLNERYLDRVWEDLVARAGDPDLVPSGQVLEEQAKEISAVAGNGAEFQRALSFLANPGFSEAAYDWLCGRPISTEAALAIGVRGQLDDPVMCRYGVQLLTALMTGSGRPFMVVLDQCEKFLLEEGDPIPANVGLLQSLVEAIPRAGGMLLLVTSEAGWDCVPPDFRQRIGAGAVRLLPLTPDEARLVLSAYLATPAPDIRPFTDSGLLALLRHSGGNVRLLLQLSWASFEDAEPGAAVGATAVDAAAARHGRSPDLPGLEMLVEAKLLAVGLTAERGRTDGGTTEFCFPGGRAPRAVIRLSEAIFFDDEAARATELVRLSRKARSGGNPVFTALVVTGYVSPAVLDHLRKAVHRVLVADGSAVFSRGLDAVLAEIGHVLAGDEQPVRDPGELDETLRALTASLEQLNSVRREEAVTLQRSLAEVADRLERGEEKPASGWPARRAELAAAIAEARRRRATSDWEEFRKIRDAVVLVRLNRIRWLAVALTAAVALVFVTLATASQHPGLLGAGLGAALVAAAVAAYHGSRLITSRIRLAAVPLESRRELDLVARELRRYADPRSADPVCRYAYALTEDPDDNYRRLAAAMLGEPLALVRQAIGHRMAVTERSPADCVPEVQRGLREQTPEVLLLLARAQRHSEVDRPPRVLRDLPPELRVLVALANPGAPDLADGAISRHPAELVLAALGVRGPGHPLARARGGPPGSVPIEIPRNELRAAAHLLSPLEPDGLGTYDWLPLVAEIDGLYLFFEELLYHQEEMTSNRPKS
ncbi:BREX system ATP-binding domain-containing protein [Nonomuraea sp. NPDC023979]|uniref:BREX system ATP-binding domain-containing protein n=1 Tax=Nonomuraea sp. NPDC023979 TaxID=3154796 RepID=UPI0033E8E52C